MTDLSAAQVTLRKITQYRYSGYLSTPTETAVLTGTVTADAAEPAFFLSYTTNTGSYTDVVRMMEVKVYSSGGAFKGRVRVALPTATNEITATNLPINEISRGRIQIVTGDTFEVVRSFRLRDMLVGQDSSFPKDSRWYYVDQNELVAPVTNSGGHWCGDTAMQTRTVGITDYTNRSILMDADSSSLTYYRDVVDGTILSGTTTTSTARVTYPVGDRWIRTTATDADNGMYFDKYVWIRVHDDTDPPISVQMRSLRATREGGWSAEFSVPMASAAAITSLPEGALICYWEKEYYLNVLWAFGGDVDDRSHIKFTGFLNSESITYDPIQDELVFRAVSPLAVLGGLPGFSQSLTETVDPGTWQQYKGLTIKQMLVYLLRWHTNLLTSFDLLMPFADQTYPAFAIQQANTGDQIREVLHALSCQFTCTRSGVFKADKNLQRRTTSERASTTTALALASADMMRMDATWEHRYRIGQLEAKGFTAGSNPQPMKAVAPGEAPAEAPDIVAEERLIVTAQSDLNTMAGLAFAEQNSLYNGTPVPRGMSISMPPTYDVFDPADFEYLTLTHAPDADSPASRRAWAGESVILQEVEITHTPDTGAKEITWKVDAETFGPAGTTRVVDSDITFPDDDYYPPTPPNPDYGYSGVYGKGIQNMALICANGIAKTTDFQTPDVAGGPTYTATLWSSIGLTGTLQVHVPNGFAAVAGAPASWIVTNTKIWYLVLGALTLTDKYTFTDSTQVYRAADASFAEANFFAVCSHEVNRGMYCVATTNNSSFTEYSMGGGHSTNDATTYPGCYIPSKTGVTGRIYSSRFTSTGSFGSIAGEGARSTDHGATWGAHSGIVASDALAFEIDSPYHDNASDSVIYTRKFINSNPTATRHKLYRGSTDVSPSIGGVTFSPIVSRSALASSVTNRQRVLFAGGSGNATNAVFLSSNAGDSWTTIADVGTDYRRVALSGDSQNVGWAWGVNSAIAQLAISGNTATFDDRSGNLASLGLGEIIAIAGY